jgi:probable F420-dependent oxidoreductase
VEVYAGMDPRLPLGEVAAYARRVEALGFDGVHVAETIHDSLAVSLLAVEHTERLTIRTAVALAFVRSPTLTAYAAWDVSRASGGRFELGLGTQIRQNIEDRFGMPWTEPVARMREYLDALAALYDAFRTGGEPDVEGASYRISRLQPYFNPGPDEDTTPPPTWLGGVGRGMCELAGERAAGLVTHPTNSDPAHLTETVRPALAAGARRAGRRPEDVRLVVAPTVISGVDDRSVEEERERQRRLLAFLYSTPAYSPALERQGRDDLPGRLRALIRTDEWDRLPTLLTDELLDALAVVGPYDELGDRIVDRYGALADGVGLPALADPAADDRVARLVADLHVPVAAPPDLD